MKLVVTGQTADGRSVFSEVGVPARSSSPGSYELWSTRGGVVLPDSTPAESPAEIGYFPAEGETCFKIVSVPPASDGQSGDLFAHMPPDLARHFDSDDPGMHTTDTIDYVVVLAGAAELELDEGCKEVVGQGDCVVQRGTRHAWRVLGNEPLVLAATLIGAKRS